MHAQAITTVFFEIGAWSAKAGYRSSAESLKLWRFARSIGIRPEAYVAFLKAELNV